MGGTKCTFRSCHVNTINFPKMHFFHYPVKKSELMDKWVQMAKTHYIQELPLSQQRNKCVCLLHFRHECFMNYFKNRLVPDAVPTLDRVCQGFVLDYTTSDNPSPIEFPAPTQDHLIIPKNLQNHFEDYSYVQTCALNSSIAIKSLSSGNEASLLKKPKQSTSLSSQDLQDLNVEYQDYSHSQTFDLNSSIKTKNFCSENESPLPKKPKISVLPTPALNSPKILNNLKSKASKSDIKKDNFNLVIELPTDQDIFDSDSQLIELLDSPDTSASNDQIYTTTSISPTPILFKTDAETQTDTHMFSAEHCDEIVKDNKTQIELMKESHEESMSAMYKRISQLEKELKEAKACSLAAEKRAELAEKTAKYLIEDQKKLAQVGTVSTSNEKSTTPTQMTKPQLFNGIKKYLNASMTALVRMEMFSNAERQWKPDEKQVSVDIMQLGQNVYQYFVDEWRFRLPSKIFVEKWMSEENTMDEEDL